MGSDDKHMPWLPLTRVCWLLVALCFRFTFGAPVAPTPKYDVWFGEGCFWERQYAYVSIELNQTGPFKRTNSTVTSVTGYAGSKLTGTDGLVCYDNDSSNDYGSLGHCEVVGVQLDQDREAEQFAFLVNDFYNSFTPTASGFVRPDLPPNLPVGDVGAPYRTVVGIPGGVNGALHKVLTALNVPRGPYNMTMNLKPDNTGNKTQDELNTVWVMDSNVFPFYRAEQYHQFHSNFFPNPQQPPEYPRWYLDDLYQLQVKLGRIPPTGCSDSYCPPGPDGSCHW